MSIAKQPKDTQKAQQPAHKKSRTNNQSKDLNNKESVNTSSGGVATFLDKELAE